MSHPSLLQLVLPIHRMPSAAPHRVRGFTLIEMVAAFLIFAIGVGILMQQLSSSLHSTRLSAGYTQAALWAQSKLDTLGIGERLYAGQSGGEFDKTYRWELNIQELDPQTVEASITTTAPSPVIGLSTTPAAGKPLPGGIQDVTAMNLYQAELTVLWGGRSARFVTMRVQSPETANNASLVPPNTRRSAPQSNR